MSPYSWYYYKLIKGERGILERKRLASVPLSKRPVSIMVLEQEEVTRRVKDAAKRTGLLCCSSQRCRNEPHPTGNASTVTSLSSFTVSRSKARKRGGTIKNKGHYTDKATRVPNAELPLALKDIIGTCSKI